MNRVHQAGKEQATPSARQKDQEKGGMWGLQISAGIYSLSNINQGSRKQQKMRLGQEQGLRRCAVTCSDGNMEVVF